MACFAVFHKNKQIRVFMYPLGFDDKAKEDREQQKTNAFNFARSNHEAGYPCQVEEFGLSGVGCIVLDTSK